MRDMTSSLQNAFCCWASSQQSPVDDRPCSPSSPDSPNSPCIHQSHNPFRIHEKPMVSAAQAQAQVHPSASVDDKEARLYAKKQLSPSHTLAPMPRAWPRSHIKGVFAKKSSPSALDVVSPYHSTTFMLTQPSAYSYNGNNTQSSTTGKSPSPSKRISLHKYYYGRNTMSAGSSSRPRTPSPPQSPRPLATTSKSVPLPSPSIPALSLSLSPLSSAPSGISSQPCAPNASTSTKADAGSSPFLTHTSSSTSSLALSIPPPNSVPTLNTILATPITPSQPSLPALSSPRLSVSPPPSSPMSPSLSSSFSSPITMISSPQRTEHTPFPASPISPAKLATLIETASRSSVDACAGSRRSQPLILDLRPQTVFLPLAIQQSINISMPTLLMRRYRRGVAVSSCSIESFITMPSDKDLFHSIQESWSLLEPVDIIVLDHDMSAGPEEYGRSATAAWTLVNVLEQGAGIQFQQQQVRLWYLEGGFEAIQTWDAGEKFLVREGGLLSSSSVASLTGTLSCSPPAMSPLPTKSDTEEEMPLAKPQRRASMKPSLSIDTASIVFTPKGATATTANKPVRRESLFSLNTKVVRPPGLSRSQTVGSASAPHLKPLMIPPPINTSSQPQQKSWLTVPTSTPAPSLSPVMSMEMNLPASTDHAFASTPSTWSANSTNGSGHFNVPQLSLKSKRSFSSINTTATSIREEGDESETDLSSFSPDSQRQTKGDFHREYESRMFNSEGSTFQYYNNDTHHHDCSMDYDQEEEDENKGEQEISCILPGFLYLGPEIVTEAQVQELQNLGVKRVLNMAQECEDKVLVCKDQFEYHKIGVYDHVEADVSAGLLKAVEIVASSTESPIYVHCKAGKSRSVTATIAYLIMHLHWPLNKAYQHVLTQRPCMCPNIGFVTELMKVEKQTFGAEATGLHMRA